MQDRKRQDKKIKHDDMLALFLMLEGIENLFIFVIRKILPNLPLAILYK